MMIRRALSVTILVVLASTPVARAEVDGNGPDLWRVTGGVAVDDVLNARMGPGTNYPVIEQFASDMERAGWVAQRFMTRDNGAASTLPEGAGSSDVSNPLERLSARFLEGYEEQDTLQVLDQVLANLEPVNSQSSVFLPSAQIRPLTMAVLALEASEGVRGRVRYRITYGIEPFPDLASRVPYPVSFIQVDRFSLGSAIRQDAIDSIGAEYVEPPEAFDVGPHVSWRFVTRPVQGAASDIVAAGRIELSEAQAQG